MTATVKSISCKYVLAFEKYWELLCYGLDCSGAKAFMDQAACDRFILKNGCIEDYCSTGSLIANCDTGSDCNLTITDNFISPTCGFFQIITN